MKLLILICILASLNSFAQYPSIAIGFKLATGNGISIDGNTYKKMGYEIQLRFLQYDKEQKIKDTVVQDLDYNLLSAFGPHLYWKAADSSWVLLLEDTQIHEYSQVLISNTQSSKQMRIDYNPEKKYPDYSYEIEGAITFTPGDYSFEAVNCQTSYCKIAVDSAIKMK